MKDTLSANEEILRENKDLNLRISELQADKQKCHEIVEKHQSHIDKLNERLSANEKMFSIIAHDLRTPFTSLLGFSELLLENESNYSRDKVKLMLFQIHAAAKSAFSFVENLLFWIKAQNGELKLNPQKTDITNLINEVVTKLNSLAVLKKIVIHHHWTDNIFGTVDLHMVQTILRNLLINAIKYSYPDGKIDIQAVSNDSEVIISIRDNGIGMTDEIQTRLFQNGINKSNLGTQGEQGTGLGLTLCHEFIKKHGGQIWVESKPLNGTNISFTLPLALPNLAIKL